MILWVALFKFTSKKLAKYTDLFVLRIIMQNYFNSPTTIKIDLSRI